VISTSLRPLCATSKQHRRSIIHIASGSLQQLYSLLSFRSQSHQLPGSANPVSVFATQIFTLSLRSGHHPPSLCLPAPHRPLQLERCLSSPCCYLGPEQSPMGMYRSYDPSLGTTRVRLTDRQRLRMARHSDRPAHQPAPVLLGCPVADRPGAVRGPVRRALERLGCEVH
jgi:hypothetical protein